MADVESPQQADRPILTLIQHLKDGAVVPSALTREQRQGCVAVLRLEGYTHAQMAQVLTVSEKTIQRDLADIRARNAASPPSQEHARQIIGEFLVKMEAHHTHLMRLARDKNASVAERVQAEFFAARVLNDLLLRLQSLGYLPERPQHVIGDFVHRLTEDGGAEPTLEATEQIIQEIELVGQETGFDPTMTEELKALRQRVEQAKLQQDAQRLLSQQQCASADPKEDSDRR